MWNQIIRSCQAGVRNFLTDSERGRLRPQREAVRTCWNMPDPSEPLNAIYARSLIKYVRPGKWAGSTDSAVDKSLPDRPLVKPQHRDSSLSDKRNARHSQARMRAQHAMLQNACQTSNAGFKERRE